MPTHQQPPLRLRLFGRPEVEHANRVIALDADRRCRLLALLALRRDWVGRAELSGLLWPERAQKLAYTNLRKVLHLMRDVPWAGALEIKGAAVRFDPGTDVTDFEIALRDGRVTDALQLRRGELLDGFDDDANPAWTDWLRTERTRLARRTHEAARAHLVALGGEPRQRAAFARCLLDEDPLDEDAVVALLSAQRELKAPGEQQRTFRAYATRLTEELGVEPSLRVRAELHGAVASVTPVASPPALERTRSEGFIGREGEIEELALMLARAECRLVTVTGPGGVGKSRIVKESLRGLHARFTDGVCFIALDDLADVTHVSARLAAELDLKPVAGDDPLRCVAASLSVRTMLLVLDNCEHLSGLARLIERLLQQAPRTKICATSRARLGLANEWLLPLTGLASAASHAHADEQLTSEAVRLFIAAARAASPDFDATAQAGAIGRLMRALDGLPLAILLAAHWTRLLPVSEIAAEVGRSIDVLQSADDGDERAEHRSVRATFEQSWQLLAPREQQALAALSVFAGSFARDAAREVSGAGLPLVAALADKSLLQIDGARCSLHPLIRQFASEKLGTQAHAEAARRHADWYHGLIARAHAAGDAAVRDAIGAELENCRLAWRWAVAQRAHGALAAAAVPLMQFFDLSGRAEEGCALLREGLSANGATAPAHVAALLAAVAQLEHRLYRLDEADASALQGLRAARQARHPAALQRCLNVLALNHQRRGRDRAARRIFEQSLRQARAANDTRAIAGALGHLANLDKDAGDFERARERMLEVLAMQRRLDDWVGVAARLNGLAHLHQSLGQLAQGRAYLDEALAVSEQHGIAFARPHLLFNLANLSLATGALDESAAAGRRALDEARATANRGVEVAALLHLVRITVRRGDTAGARADLNHAIACANATGSPPMQLDAVFCFAEIAAAEGDSRRAAALMRYYIERPETAAGDRAGAQASLDGLPGGGAGAATVDLPLEALLGQLSEETARRA